MSIIATPDAVIEVADPPTPPTGVDWDLLPDEALTEMPVLGDLRALGQRKS